VDFSRFERNSVNPAGAPWNIRKKQLRRVAFIRSIVRNSGGAFGLASLAVVLTACHGRTLS
jgi:hypothetical protein